MEMLEESAFLNWSELELWRRGALNQIPPLPFYRPLFRRQPEPPNQRCTFG
jgi:hypothetical protein